MGGAGAAWVAAGAADDAAALEDAAATSGTRSGELLTDLVGECSFPGVVSWVSAGAAESTAADDGAAANALPSESTN